MAGGTMKEIRHRIKSVESTRQITKAMELVASSKLRRAREQAEAAQPMFTLLEETIPELLADVSETASIYLRPRPIRRSGFIVIAGDRGLAGGYNGNLFKYAQELMRDKKGTVVAIGRKAEEYFSRRDWPLRKPSCSAVEEFGVSQALKLGGWIAESYLKGEVDECFLIYTKFISVLSQQPAHIRVLPLERSKQPGKSGGMLYEPEAASVLAQVMPMYLGELIYGAVSESFVSEQAARRTAMEAANKNADEMIETLNLSYNRARQTTITQEITEIVAGAQALE